jgi:hypothetical protein
MLGDGCDLHQCAPAMSSIWLSTDRNPGERIASLAPRHWCNAPVLADEFGLTPQAPCQPRVTLAAMSEAPAELLRQHWVHSREEDSGDVRVYRPAGYDFPPARGRRGFELKPDGEMLVYGPGADDRPEATTARWSSSAGDRVKLGDEDFEIVSLSPDRLVVRPSDA